MTREQFDELIDLKKRIVDFEQGDEDGIVFCDTNSEGCQSISTFAPKLQVWKGIKKLSKLVGNKRIKVVSRETYDEYSFMYKGVRVFELIDRESDKVEEWA